MANPIKLFSNFFETFIFTIGVQAMLIPFASIYIRHYPEEYTIGSFIMIWAVCTTAAAFADTDNFFMNAETKIRYSNWIHNS